MPANNKFYYNLLLAGRVPDNNLLLVGRVPDNNLLLAGRVPDNNLLLAERVPDNNLLLAGRVPDNNFILQLKQSRYPEKSFFLKYQFKFDICEGTDNL